MCRELAGGSFGRWKLRILYLVVILMNRTNHRTNHCFRSTTPRIQSVCVTACLEMDGMFERVDIERVDIGKIFICEPIGHQMNSTRTNN